MTILEIIIGFIVGGGLVTLITIRASKRKANAEADASVTDNYEKYLERVEQRLSCYEGKVDNLTEKTEELSKIILAAFRCPIITQHPDATCPVQDEYRLMHKED